MKYYLKRIKKIPLEIIDKIYTYLPIIKIEKSKYYFKRLITPDYKYYFNMNLKYRLNRENRLLDILMKQKAYHIIDDIHYNNLK